MVPPAGMHKSTAKDKSPRWNLERAIQVLALVLLTIVAYWGVWRNGFVNFDDHTYLTQNTHIARGLTAPAVKWAFTEFYTCNWHPLTWLSHMLDIEMFRLRPAGHHVVSLCFHIANTLLLFGFLVYTTRRPWPAFLVAAFFALHPLHVESVAWASERKDVLSTFFWFSSMWMYAAYVRRPGVWRYLATLALFACGLMSKPMLVTLPLILLMLDYWPLDRLSPERANIRKLLIEKTPLFIMSLLSSIITMLAQQGAISPVDTVSVPTRLTNAIISYGRYLADTFWPFGLAAIYPFPTGPQYALAAGVLLILVAITIAVFRLGRRYKFLTAGWLWYLVTLLPVIGLIQVGEQSHADRYTYIPLVGIFFAIVWASAEVMGSKPALRKAAGVVAGAILLALVALTAKQVTYWRSSESLFEHAIAVTKDNHVAMTNLGNAIGPQGQLDKAMALFNRSYAIAPAKAETLSGIGNVFFQRGQRDKACEYYQKAVELRPDLPMAQLNAGSALVALGRYAEAEPYLRRAIQMDSGWAEPQAQLGVVLAATGRVNEGIAACRKAIELNPDLGAAHFSIAAMYAMNDQLDLAISEYRICMAMDPTYAVRKNLATCLLVSGRKEEALAQFTEALKLSPQIAESHYNVAKALDSLGRRAEAAIEVQKALSIEPGNAELKEYLGKLQ
jgi:protein O-mannosyl-transferase